MVANKFVVQIVHVITCHSHTCVDVVTVDKWTELDGTQMHPPPHGTTGDTVTLKFVALKVWFETILNILTCHMYRGSLTSPIVLPSTLPFTFWSTPGI